MKRLLQLSLACVATACFVWAVGCDREVAHTEETKIKDDGTVKTKEKTVTEHPDGTTTVTEEEKKTTPH